MKHTVREEYLKEVKSLFPLWTKEERNFFRQFSCQVCDFEEQAEKAELTKDDLYSAIGRPDEVLASYLTQADISYITRQIQRTKFIRLFTIIAVIISVCIFLTCLIWSVIIIQEYRHFDDYQIYYEETIIS